ncbi:MAG: ATP synthase F1 subunit gamma [Candidatus Omnitrophota bacterium]
MSDIRHIKEKQATIKRIRKITYAMQVVAETRLARIKKKAVEIKNYHNKLRLILSDVIARSTEEYHPLMEIRKTVKTVGVIMVNSDEGMCGGFNNNVFNRVRDFIKRHGGKKFKFISFGRKSERFLRGVEKDSVIKRFSGIAAENRHTIAEEASDEIINLFLTGALDEVYIIYNEYRINILGRASELKILPVEPVLHKVKEKTVSDYLYEPSASELLSALLPEYVLELIFYSLVESRAAEELARQLAMKNATDNADEIMKKLSFAYHRARQAVITNEIAEIVNAAQSVTG